MKQQSEYNRMENERGFTQKHRGAFVSFGQPQKATGVVDFRFDSAPHRDYGFDTDFFSSDKLRPMTPVLLTSVRNYLLGVLLRTANTELSRG